MRVERRIARATLPVLAVLFSAGSGLAQPLTAPSFKDVTETAGIDYRNVCGAEAETKDA